MKGRKATHIPGFDELVGGGFAEGTINLLTGPPGSAKSLFGIQYLVNGAEVDGETGIYLSLEEGRDSIFRAAKGFSLDLETLEARGKIFIVDIGKMRMECSSTEELEWGLASFETLNDFLKNHLSFSGATRLVLDSVTAAGLYYRSPELLRRELFKFARSLRGSGLTSLMISEQSTEGEMKYGIEDFVSDSLIKLDYESSSGEYRRTVVVKKMRFTKHDPLKHPFLVLDSGIEVSPEEVIG